MASPLTGCLKKGVVIGRMSQAINDLYMNHDFTNSPKLQVSRDSIDDLKDLLRPLKKNFRTASEEVQKIEAGLKNVSKLIRGKPKKESVEATRKELLELRTNFRKVIAKGFSECGLAKQDSYTITEFTNDNAFYYDTHPEHKAEMDKLRDEPWSGFKGASS